MPRAAARGGGAETTFRQARSTACTGATYRASSRGSCAAPAGLWRRPGSREDATSRRRLRWKGAGYNSHKRHATPCFKGTAMDLPVNYFKRAIASGKTPIGAWLVSGAASTAEALGCVGFDFLVVDTEHTPIDVPQMIGILQTLAGTTAQAIVRPPWNDIVMVKRVLDAGAQSLLFPFVQNAEEAKRAVANTRYPPAGVRRLS